VSTPADEAIAREPAVEAPTADPGDASVTATQPDEDLQPPALIVRLRAPDRAVARIIGPIAPEHARRGVVIGFGISAEGRLAERAAQARAAVPHPAANVLALPHPRLSPPPTRIASSSFDREPEGG
jgi:hypothetical protein